MIIKKYGDRPEVYTADIGEVVKVRLSMADPWVRAVITNVSRRRNGTIRYWFVWLETWEHSTARAGERSHVYVSPDGPLLLRQFDGPGPTSR
jgi:hypothetical protein